MQIVDVTCPECHSSFIVDRSLWSVGSVELRCPECAAYFLPDGSPRDRTAEDAARSSVPLRIFRPDAGRGR